MFVGALPDGRTPCLKVTAERKTPELNREVPKTLEDYPVVLQETGPIRPLGILLRSWPICSRQVKAIKAAMD